ncbi:MAG TPA: rod shape-determining protein MreC [Chitinispirillaceae bacterium]|nr:rod shape-determining protein MreC [Chitinispirillaceae bacterium]
MQWIFEFILKYRTFCSLLFTTFLSLWMISGSSERQISTARWLTTTIFYPLQLTFNQINIVEDIYSENRRLKMDNAQLNVKIAILQDQAAENKRLRDLLCFSNTYTYGLIPVRVIARDPSIAYKSVVISAGKKDSVLTYMPIVSEKGVVGKVIQVMNGISLVQLLKDPSNRTSVMSQRTRTVSILETNDGRNFFIRVRNHEDFKTGDTIVTSGLGGVYPKGLAVGLVTENVNNSFDPLFKKVSIKPAVDFEHIEELFVIHLSPQWVAFRSEMDSMELENND